MVAEEQGGVEMGCSPGFRRGLSRTLGSFGCGPWGVQGVGCWLSGQCLLDVRSSLGTVGTEEPESIWIRSSSPHWEQVATLYLADLGRVNVPVQNGVLISTQRGSIAAALQGSYESPRGPEVWPKNRQVGFCHCSLRTTMA